MSGYSQIDISALISIAKKAGEAVIDIYNTDDFNTEFKDDDSPLTKADLASNEIIVKGLKNAYPGIPTISEEHTKEENLKHMQNSETVFIVDPLDGTKDFIERKGSFTIMIGVLHKKEPVMGVVYAPVINSMYYGSKGGSAYMNGKKIKVSKGKKVKVAVASRSHFDEGTQKFLKQFNDIELIQAGSSLKFCLVAEGKAEVYPRFHPCMEWDTAAADAILRAAGGEIITEDKKPLTYGKPQLKNPSIIAINKKVKFYI